MEQTEAAQKEVARANGEANEAKKLADSQIAELDQREENLKKELAELQQGRAELRPPWTKPRATVTNGCSRARAKTWSSASNTACAAAAT